ncbi:MAG TPA: DoxX family protein [Solirubrobacterales bacterium]|nr:DoxX family protein [Solirubrobacterales bacterium]
MTAGAETLLRTRRTPLARWSPPLRWLSGAVFLVFGIGKFAAHGEEVEAFAAYGLPAPEAFVYLVGTLEIVAGALLLAGLLTRFAALALTGNMAGAIVVSGIGEGEVLPSLTLAPALLAAMLFLLWVGPGERALDARVLRARLAPGPR